MNVLLCASEAVPFAKTGGLADVVGALPKALKVNGVNVKVILPFYKKIKEKNLAFYVGYAYVKIMDRMEYVGVFTTKYEDIDFYFIDNERYFYRDGLYGYGDDGERFAFFNFAVIEAIKVINFYPDIIHLNDWQTGLIPYILKANYRFYPEFSRIKTVFSIHNIQYQGSFPFDIMRILYFPYSNSLEFQGSINFMKAAIVESSIVTTVSNTYKNEVLTDEYGYYLNNILGTRYYDFYGIVNGIDIEKYNPETDKYLFANYSAVNFVEGKRKNKEKLLADMHMENPDAPLFGLVSRLVDQKGIDLLMPILEDVINYSNANFIFVGNGEKRYENYFKAMEDRYPNRFKAYIGYSDSLAQNVYAASDIFLMPSKFEPCGLGQLIAMRYGTLPLVRETGGLKDTVIPFNQFTNEGTGFSFTNYNAIDLKTVMFLAIEVFNNNKSAWKNLTVQAMSQDFSWNKSAKEYLEIYKKLI